MADEKFPIFKRAFRELVGHNILSSPLDNRVIAQKIAYILFRKNISALTYTEYIWYIHGVFNYDLWHSLLYNIEEEAQIPENELTPIKEFRQECEDAGLTDYFSDSKKMELITTILHVAKQKADLNEDNVDLIDTVLQYKNKFNEQEVKEAISKLKKIDWDFSI